jgi:hypothetical protein
VSAAPLDRFRALLPLDWRNLRQPTDVERELARRAASRLDEVSPGWFHRVRPRQLVMSNPRLCLLGQVFGGYSPGVRALRAAALTAGGSPLRGDRALVGDVLETFQSHFPVLAWDHEVRRRRRDPSTSVPAVTS